MSGVLLGYTNRIDTSTLSGGSWAATLPLTNLKNRVLGKVARSTDATNASTKFDINLTNANVPIRIVSLVNHNFTTAATYRVRGASDAGFTTVLYDSGVKSVYPSVYLPEDLEWEMVNWWSGTPSDEDIQGYTTNLVEITTAPTFAQYWRVEIFDSANAAGYVQVGRVMICQAWKPTRDASVGASTGWETTTSMTRALSGAKYFQAKVPARSTKFSLDVMSVNEAMGNAFEIDRRSGIDKEVMYIMDEADTLQALRRRYLGTIRELSPIEYPYSNLLSKTYIIDELI